MLNYCESCGQGRDGSVGLYIELDDNGLCQECAAIFCDICGQEHNASEDNQYCNHCKEWIPPEKWTETERLPNGDAMLFCESCKKTTQHTKTPINNFFVYECCVCPRNHRL